MILEVAILKVRKGQAENFENDFKKAGQYISKAKGYINHTLKKGIKNPNQYILLVNWETYEDHEEGFRKSKDYQHWKALLHHYYDPFPTVEHFITIV